MKKIAIVAVLGFMPLVGAFAQQDSTVNRTVIVENEYNPTVMDASKINVMPKMNEPKATKKNINYATSLRPVSAWDYQAMSPVVREWESVPAYRGYLRGGHGNNGNVDLAAGYLWDITKKDRLDFSALLDGHNYEAEDPNGEDWKNRFYRTKVGLDYKHAFNKVDFFLGGNYSSQVFNYMPSEFYIGGVTKSGVCPQHQTLLDGYFGLASTDEDMPVQFAFSAGMKHFKMNHETDAMQSGSENNLYVRGDVWKRLSDGNHMGLDVKFDNYSYSLNQFAEADRAYDMDHAIAIDLNPYYSMENDQWRLRIGVNVDWWGGEEGKVFISPDVLAECVFAERYVLYGQAVGGRKTNSFYQLSSQFSPYWTTKSLVSSYTSMDASAGLKGSPVNGLWFNLAGGYRITENDLSPYLMSDTWVSLVSFVQGKSKALYASAELKYDYKDLWNMFLKGTYYNWSWDYPEEVNQTKLGLQPEMEINGGVGVKVVEGVNVNLGYEYVKRCNQMYEPVNNLYLGATYDLFKNLQVYGKINNLLNKDYVRMDAYPAQGLNFLAGATFQF